MAKEKIEIEFVEASLENTLEEMKNRRDFIKKAMKPAEKAKDELEKATATEKVRLQGTKETKAPNLKPYTEALDVKDRKELGQLISGAKADGRPWTVKRCSPEKLKEGYRYTFFTNKVEGVFTESLHTNDLVLEESHEEEKHVCEKCGKEICECDKTLKEDAEEETVEIDLPPVEEPTDLVLDIEEPSDPVSDCDECHRAIDILKGKLNFHPGEEDGTFVLCLVDEDGKETECVELKGLSDEELTTLSAIFFEHEEFAKEQGEEAPEEEVPEENAVELELGGEEPIEEASSAEKRAYKNGKQDLDDLDFGKALARIKDPHERAMLLHQHKLEQSGKMMSDRASTNSTLTRKLAQAKDANDKKLNKMYAAGYAVGESEEEQPLEEGVKISLDDLTLFKPWGGAKDVWELIIAQEKLEALDKALEDMYPDGITATDLNDILWFEKDWIFDTIDLKPFIPQADAVEVEPEEVVVTGDTEVTSGKATSPVKEA